LEISEIPIFESGLLPNASLGKPYGKSLGQNKIEDPAIPLDAIAGDISNGKKVILDKGPIAQALMAGICIHGEASPVEFKEKILVDRAIVENIPIDTKMWMRIMQLEWS
jgi:NTE family protein